jgi:predicted Fe-Mo cluster-binding NifX family protein
MTNKSINGVTPVSGGSSAQYLSADGTYNTPAGAGDMLKAAYDPANINEQLVGLVSTQTLTNKTVNGVILNAAGSASLFLNEAGAYVTPAGGGDMVAAVYDAAGITEQLVGLTATQTLTNKTVNGVVLDAAGSSALFLNQIGTYSAPPSGGGAVDTVASADGSIAVTGTTDIDLSVTRKDLPNNQTGLTYTFVLTDAGKTVWGENASAQEFTIPTNASVAFPINTTILVTQEGAGAVTITGDTGVTVNNVLAKSETINTQFQGAILVKRGTDDWKISGDIGTGGGGGGSTNWTLTTSSVTAAAGEKHISSGVSTIITFPSAPDDGTPIEVIRDDSTNVQAVARGGSDTINDVTTNMTLDTDQGRTLFVYDSVNTNWKVYNV